MSSIAPLFYTNVCNFLESNLPVFPFSHFFNYGFIFFYHSRTASRPKTQVQGQGHKKNLSSGSF